MPTYLWRNIYTDEHVEVLASIADRDVPPDAGDGWERVMTAPMVLNHSFLDGQRAKNDQTYDKLKKAAHLEVDYAQASHGSPERREIGKELDKLKKV